ncbi:MAG: phosphoribosylaminoimidazolesuccinocarboxamide synthase [Deltaproteobacteria bacterium]|nr:phosphoribosylaminoimidazolesuccinocarboxamide synthase [Deltaproteobacteria bacterium]
MVDIATLRAALAHPLERTLLQGLGARVEGKVRDCYSPGDGRRILVTTDRISAFDRVLGTLPLKGQVLNQLAVFWFERTAHLAPNHLLAAPDPNVLVGVECEPLPVELVVRSYLTGVTSTSVWTAYARGERTFCGHALPDGLRKNDPLPHPIVTPSTKAPKGGHDVSVAAEALVRDGVVSGEDLRLVSERALALFAFGQAWCAARGLILVDTKYEFGRAPDGRLLVIDEMHTPDSSRYWFQGTYAERHARGEEPESLDKEYVRRWLAAQGFTGEGAQPPLTDEVRVEAARRYVEAFERITGAPFTADLRPPEPRLRAALGLTT